MSAIDLAQHRSLLGELFFAATAATNGSLLLGRGGSVEGSTWHYRTQSLDFQFPLPTTEHGGKLVVVGAGKAAASLAAGLELSLGSRIHAGCIITKYGHAMPLTRSRVIEAGHPVPDEAGALGTQAVLALVGNLSTHDCAFVVLTGGASALLTAPASGLTLEDKSVVNALLVRSGASINHINVVRKHLSAVKGGGLLRLSNGARLCTLVISDVIGDDLSTIGSGPTVADPSTFQDALEVLSTHGLMHVVPERALERLRSGALGLVPETLKPDDNRLTRNTSLIIANLGHALAAMSERASALGLATQMQADAIRGDTHVAARRFADWILRSLDRRVRGAPPLALIAGGETTLVVRGRGRGGRNQEFALVVARELRGVPNVTVLAAGTDGTDGPTDAAGAYADGSTCERAVARGIDPEKTLANNDSYALFAALGDHFHSGPTGTNVTDVCVAIVG